jgi:PiT family inorganic phosphate transporter
MTASTSAEHHKPKLDVKVPMGLVMLFIALVAAGVGFVAKGVYDDVTGVGEVLAWGTVILLGGALLIALSFEFVNGFHDTANAVATVIYTKSMPPQVAVVWSGFFNFLGVLSATGAITWGLFKLFSVLFSPGSVAWGVVSLLPVELILQVGSKAGYAMIFALLFAAIIWNLGTWALGIPNSSSHALIGSILGVGIANQLMAKSGQATSGVDVDQVWKVGQALLFSPLCGFLVAGLLLWLMKILIPIKKLYTEPQPGEKTPWWIRVILILTCTCVSFAHGSNDGQKGMGLIMLILIGAAPTAYALNRALPEKEAPAFVATATQAQGAFEKLAGPSPARLAPAAARDDLGLALRKGQTSTPQVYADLSVLSGDIAQQVKSYGSLHKVPAAATPNVRTDMFLVAETLRRADKAHVKFDKGVGDLLKDFHKKLDTGTRHIPVWVGFAVALALGLGTMVGWKRIVVTVGERIGKSHLTYGQGAAAEIVAAGTIMAANAYGLPVSTTHILSSGVAGTMAANGSGLQWSTVRSIASAWVLTLPAAIMLAGSLYWLFTQLIGH